LRSRMRRRMRRSTLTNGAAFTREMEDAYRKMWADANARATQSRAIPDGPTLRGAG
jgi:hypothetical protein